MDTDVLRETVSRVETLSTEISRLSTQIQAKAGGARENIEPLARKNAGTEVQRKNIREIFKVLENVQEYTSVIDEYSQIINGGINVSGAELYGKTWRELNATLQDLVSSEYRKFYGLIEQAEALQKTAHHNLEVSVVECTQDAFPVVDASHIEASDRGSLVALKEILAFADQMNCSFDAEATFAHHFQASVGSSVEKVAATVSASPDLKKFVVFVKAYITELDKALAQVFTGKRLEHYLGIVQQITKQESTRLNSRVSRSKPNPGQDELEVFDSLESALLLDETTEIISLKTKGFDKLRSIYLQLDDAAKRTRVESESSITMATNKVVSTIKELCKRSTSVLAALETEPLRMYLPTSPPPEWLAKFPVPRDTTKYLELYFADLIECLCTNLYNAIRESKTQSYQQGVFLVINSEFIGHYFQSNGLQDTVGKMTYDRLEKLDKLGFKLYLSDWQRLSGYLMDPTQVKPGAKLSSKDREAIKDRFSKFNAEFDMLTQRQKRISIPDKVLRKKLANEVAKTIGPLYKLFYDKHCGGDFTKNLDKYIKFEPKQLEGILKNM